MKPLKLMALDTEDLEVVSAQLQDAVTNPSMIEFVPKDQRFSLVVNRFAWDAQKPRSWFRKQTEFERRQAVLSVGSVQSVQSLDIDRSKEDQVLSLLALRYRASETPSGWIELVFSGGPVIRLAVEAIEVQLADLGSAWSTKFKPRHPLA